LEAGENPAAERLDAGMAVIQEVGGREEAGDRLDPARCSIDRVARLGLAGTAVRPDHEREVSAGRTTDDPQPVRVDTIILGVRADVPDRSVQVADDFGDRELRLAAV